jgi:hypothetical protein
LLWLEKKSLKAPRKKDAGRKPLVGLKKPMLARSPEALNN